MARAPEPDLRISPIGTPGQNVPAAIARWVKTECGQAKYLELASRSGPLAKLRRWWFVVIAALRDWRLPAAGEGRSGTTP